MDAYRNFVEFTDLGSIGLTQKQTARIKDGRGRLIRVETGTVWVTHDRCNDDVILRSGESYRIPRNGGTVISTVSAPFALVTIEPGMPVKPTMGQRFWNFWAALYAPESRPTTAGL